MKDELKPCPFCGGKLDYKIQNYAYCMCGAAVKIAMKNNRPIEDAQSKRIAELESILKETVELYGKPGGPWNIPSDPGSWIEKARKALGKDHE